MNSKYFKEDYGNCKQLSMTIKYVYLDPWKYNTTHKIIKLMKRN